MKRPAATYAMVLIFTLTLSGCKEPPKKPKPTPTPTSTPQPLQDIIAFTEAGALYAVNWSGNKRRVIYTHPRNSIWFPTAANQAAQAQVGPQGRKGPHFLAWISTPNGSQNVVRIYLDGTLVPLTSTNTRTDRQMKNLRLGNAPVYSHDGKRIAYSHNGDIWLMDTDGYNATTLIADASSWSPSFSHDNKRIVYVNRYHDRSDIWVTNLEDKDTYQVTDFDDFQVGQPRFSPDDSRILLTRIQKDESNIVSVLARPDKPLADSEPVTKDNQSSNGIYSPDGIRIMYASGPLNPFKPDDPKTLKANKNIDPLNWYLWRAKPKGKAPVRLAEARGVSAAWLRPDIPKPTPTARPTRVPKKLKPAAPKAKNTKKTKLAAKPVPPKKKALKPKRPNKPKTKAAATAVPPPSAQVARRPTPKIPQRPTPIARKPKPSRIPPQPTRKAAALKLRVAVRFDSASDEITLSSLASVQKVAGRARQYSANLIRVYGPLDTSPLRGAYPSSEARSKARAQKVAAIIAKEKGVAASQIKTVPYLPQGLGSRQLPNGIQIYVSVK